MPDGPPNPGLCHRKLTGLRTVSGCMPAVLPEPLVLQSTGNAREKPEHCPTGQRRTAWCRSGWRVDGETGPARSCAARAPSVVGDVLERLLRSCARGLTPAGHRTGEGPVLGAPRLLENRRGCGMGPASIPRGSKKNGSALRMRPDPAEPTGRAQGAGPPIFGKRPTRRSSGFAGSLVPAHPVRASPGSSARPHCSSFCDKSDSSLGMALIR